MARLGSPRPPRLLRRVATTLRRAGLHAHTGRDREWDELIWYVQVHDPTSPYSYRFFPDPLHPAGSWTAAVDDPFGPPDTWRELTSALASADASASQVAAAVFRVLERTPTGELEPQADAALPPLACPSCGSRTFHLHSTAPVTVILGTDVHDLDRRIRRVVADEQLANPRAVACGDCHRPVPTSLAATLTSHVQEATWPAWEIGW
jgi:hypothetical protein